MSPPTNALHRFAAWCADIVWPRTCAIAECGRACDRPGRHICSRCFAALPFLETGGACSVCGLPVPADSPRFVCDECLRHPPAFEFARSAVRFLEPIRQTLLDFKYHRATWLAMDMVDLLEGAVRARLDAAAVDLVVPVPLHPNRLRERGYNQSAILAEGLASRLARRFDGSSVVRTRDTEHQARLNGEERRNNLRDAFAAADTRHLRGRTVLLVDDVMTTGATLNHCARAIMAAGAERVWCATTARSTLKG